MILKAGCKINLGLDVLRKRSDGYHDIQTVMLPVKELYDTVEVHPNGLGHSRLTVRGMIVDCPDDDNICLKAARAMTESFGAGGVDITLDKRIPFGAGLGGGSSDGVAVIKAVNEIFSLNLGRPQFEDVAARLGSDTVFFVRNTPQLCSGRGEIVTPVEVDLSGMVLVIAKPDEGVSTREAYAGIVPSVPALPLAERLQRPLKEWQGTVKNDFEASVFPLHPRIGQLKEALLAQGAVYASMSGSGSAVFGLFDGEVDFQPPFEGVFIHTENL